MYRNLLTQSKDLRKTQTPHEHKLWFLLRAKRLEGFKFYRQYVIQNFIVDFCCPQKKLIIELDGGGHAEEKQELKDQLRDQILTQLDYKILRVWNNEIDQNLEGVKTKIWEMMGIAPLPNPLPEGARGNTQPYN